MPAPGGAARAAHREKNGRDWVAAAAQIGGAGGAGAASAQILAEAMYWVNGSSDTRFHRIWSRWKSRRSS